MRFDRKSPKYPLLWMGFVLALTVTLGLCGWKMRMAGQARGSLVIAEQAYCKVTPYQETEPTSQEREGVMVMDVIPSTSPAPTKVQPASSKQLPDVETWSEENEQAVADSQKQVRTLQSRLGTNIRKESYTAQLVYLAALQGKANLVLSNAVATGLTVEAKTGAGSQPKATIGACSVFLAEESWAENQEILVSVVNYGNGFTLARLDGDQVIPSPTKSGYSFAGWWREGEELSAAHVTANATYTARYVDDIAPTVTETVTVLPSGNSKITLMAEDLGDGLAGLYIGKENPEETEVSYIATGDTAVGETTTEEATNGDAADRQVTAHGPSRMELSYEVEETGTYYLSAKDVDGNVVTQSFVVYALTAELDEDTEGITHFLIPNLTEVELPVAAKTGHEFLGWRTTSPTRDNPGDTTGSETSSSAEGMGTTMNTFTSICPTENMTIAPVFHAKSYTIALDAGLGACNPTTASATYGKAVGDLPEASRTGYLFAGWYTGEDGSGSKYTADTIYTTAGDLALHAAWKPIHYTISFDGNGGTTGTMESLSATYDVDAALPRNAYARAGYAFQGWSLSPDTVSTQNSLRARDRSYNGAEWLNEESVLNLTAEDGAEVVLYAVWQAIEPGTMEYRYCMGAYQYFACTTTNYVTENSSDEGALFVAITPSTKMRFGDTADWSTSLLRASLNDSSQVDFTGMKTTDTTVRKTYKGIYYNYSPYEQSPCTREDCGYSTVLAASAIANPTACQDYVFVPDVQDFYRYYTGNSWNWFWDMNLDGSPDTVALTGMAADGPTDAYYECVNAANAKWSALGWNARVWFRNSYTGYGNYPLFMSAYGVGVCNPANNEFAAYRNYCQTALEIRAMYTMPMN